ncbi:LLM class flavin-dependent oxidoreductase [Rhodococcus oryzae]|uniref:LLM class flavin-dependent oxidoreductase n=1 Tax=Rhodococcus oryzae TaxID=2571143 RepID=A0ABY2RHH1_9NOCA|nr:LLM class flavin-dependent oxidoreductase [Rhodococcus oryzae]TJZ76603.1 LLM class flavin-dependent oxidoreductase [Rhodococcus oryzae]
MELGVTTFAEVDTDGGVSPRERLRNLLEEVELAEQVGLDVYGVGEHHRADFVASAPAVVLAAAAARTSDIRLTSAVTVLSSDDPVRVFEEFATLDLISGGRAEVMAGRGSFTESFPLFGYDLADYDELFVEKLGLLLAIRDSETVTWSGNHRAPLDRQSVYPRPERPLPIWVGVGGNPESVARAGLLGLPMALAIIGGGPARFAPLADLHRRAVAEGGHDPQPIAVHAHGYIADSEEQAAAEFYPSYAAAMTALGRERGWAPMNPQSFDGLRGPGGSLVLGNPEQVAEKILDMRDTLGIERFMLHPSVGPLPHDKVMRTIELLGTKVAPLVRQ